MRARFRNGVAGWALVVTLAAPGWADVTIETSIRSGGIRGMGAFEGTTVSVISGLKQREHSTVKFTGALMELVQKLGGAGEETVSITRLDRGVVWTLNAEKRSYSEQPLSASRPGPGGRRQKQEEGKSDIVVTKSEFKVDRTRARRAINSFACEEYVVTWLLETLNLRTQERSRSVMRTNLWTTPETADLARARQEEQAFHQAYLKKVGMEISPEEARRLGLAMFASLSGASEKEIERSLARAATEWRRVQGYPIVTQVEWTLEAQEAGGTGSRPRQEERGAGGLFGGALGGLLGGGQSQSPGGGPAGPIITLTTEVKRVQVGPVPASQFEPPSDYVKQ